MSLTPIYDDLMREFEGIVGAAQAAEQAVEGDVAPAPDAPQAAEQSPTA